MRTRSLVALAALALSGCVSISVAEVQDTDIGSAVGKPIAVIQANKLGFTLLFHLVDVVKSDLDQVVNKLLVAEAKGMGASRVDLKSASTTPRQGIWALTGFLVGFPHSEAVGVAVVE